MRAPTPPALSLYRGKVMHARLAPVGHRFSYSVASILIDLDRLDEADRASPIFSVNSRNLIAFREKDHGPRDGSSLRAHCDGLLAQAGVGRPQRILLLCYPTVAGYTFNPLSVYFCLDAQGATVALIYQVHNTFGESHTYVHPVVEGQASEAGIRQAQSKQFYVSPFMEAEAEYRFRIRPPDAEVALRILETRAGKPVLSAAFHGRKRPASTAELALAVLQTLGIPWKVTAGIHLEALRLWLKGLKIQPRPAADPAGYTLADIGARREERV